MSKSHRIFITSCFAITLAVGCVESPDAEPTTHESSAVHDEDIARFLADALARNAIDDSYTYEVAAEDGNATSARVHTVGVSNAVEIPRELVMHSESSVSWCTPASPTVSVSKTIWCESCNKNDAEDCARQWANTVAINYCETQISSSGGDSACAPATYTDDICVDDTSSGVTRREQVGSDTACGTWPFRHAMWRVTYRVSGNCGYSCRSFID